MRPENKFERFWWVLELISRFEFDFRRCGIYFLNDSKFLVCSKFNQTQCGRTCACAAACLHPRNSISNVVVSVTMHDDTDVYVYLDKRCSKKHETICGRSKASLTEHHGKCLTCKSFVNHGFCLLSLSLSLCLCVLCVVCCCGARVRDDMYLYLQISQDIEICERIRICICICIRICNFICTSICIYSVILGVF